MNYSKAIKKPEQVLLNNIKHLPSESISSITLVLLVKTSFRLLKLIELPYLICKHHDSVREICCVKKAQQGISNLKKWTKWRCENLGR